MIIQKLKGLFFYTGINFFLQFKHKIQSSIYLSVQISMLDLLFWVENCEGEQHFTYFM